MKMFIAAATVLALAFPAVAHAATDVTIAFGAANAVPTTNDFRTNLESLGFTRYATVGSSILLNEDAAITFEFLGSESGYNDTFSTSSLSMTENSGFTNNFAAPVLIGTQFFAAGQLAGHLNFTSSGGIAATVGQDGFGIFLGPNQTTGGNFTTFYFGYDDEVTNQDDNHDDFIIRATVSAVPEPATWAMTIVGFGFVGASVRRRQRIAVPKLAIA